MQRLFRDKAKLSLDIERSTHDRLVRLAHKKGIPLAELVRRMVVQEVGRG